MRACWLTLIPPQPLEAIDARGYDLLARNLLTGVGLSLRALPPFCPTLLRTPGYPLFLAATEWLWGGVRGAVLAQMMVESLTTALVVRLGQELGGRRVGRIAGLLYALNGTTWRYTGDLYAEILLAPAITLALLMTVQGWCRPCKAWTAVWIGGAWGLTLLIKPNGLYLVLFVTVGLGIRARYRDGLRVWVLSLLALSLLLFPWLLRNRLRVGAWRLSSAFQVNLARVSAVATLAEVRGFRVEPWTPTWEALYDEMVRQTAAREGWSIAAVDVGDCRQRRARVEAMATTARLLLAAHPKAALTAHLRGVLRALLDPGHRFWYPLLMGRSWATTGVVPEIWPRIMWSLERGAVGDALLAFWRERVLRPPLEAKCLWWGLALIRAGLWWWGLRGLWKLRSCGGLWLAVTTVYFIVLPGPIAYARFYIPAIPAVVTLVAAGIVRYAPSPPSLSRGCVGPSPPFPSPR